MGRSRDPWFRSYSVIELQIREDKTGEKEGLPELQDIARRVGDLMVIGGTKDGSLLFYFKTPVSKDLVEHFRTEVEASGYEVGDVDWGNALLTQASVGIV